MRNHPSHPSFQSLPPRPPARRRLTPPDLSPADWNRAVDMSLRFAAPLPVQDPFDWVAENIVFDEPEVKGTFDPTGREYMREPMNNFADESIRTQTIVASPGTGKTIIIMGGSFWKMYFEPRRFLWVMPIGEKAGGARELNRTRITPNLRASPCFLEKLPTGPDRKSRIKGLQLAFGGNIIDFVGGRSTAQLKSNRCGVVNIDELDELNIQMGHQASGRKLASDRTEGVANSLINMTSTPSIEEAEAWRALMESDLRRRFLLCPHCGRQNSSRRFVLVKDAHFCVLPAKFDFGSPYEPGTEIKMAALRWDPEAKRADGTWDMDRVDRSARFECPYCGGHIRDEHRLEMDRTGRWIPTRRPGDHRGYHLPRFCAPLMRDSKDRTLIDSKSTIGGMARKFLEAYNSAEGMRGYINSELAEVHVSQEYGVNRIQSSLKPMAQPDWVALLTADYQKNHPYIWFVARRWCAFKLLPPFDISGGRPDFIAALDLPDNAAAKELCAKLVADVDAAWLPVAELMRFDSRTGRSPLVDFLLAQKITGRRLVKLFAEDAHSDTLEFRRVLYAAMGLERPPRGGDSELVAAGHCDLSGEAAWQEFAEVIAEFHVGAGMPIPARCVSIDCGYAEKFNRTVLQKCYESATVWKFYDPLVRGPQPVFWSQPRHQACLRAPLDGWQALRGKPTFRPLGSGPISRDIGLHVEDPFFGTPSAGASVVDVLEVPTDLMWLRKDDLRTRKTRHLYNVSPECSWFPKLYRPDGTRTDSSKFRREDYERQCNEQFFDEQKNQVRPRHGKGGMQSRLHPFHLDDCESYQVALATHLEFFDESPKTK